MQWGAHDIYIQCYLSAPSGIEQAQVTKAKDDSVEACQVFKTRPPERRPGVRGRLPVSRPNTMSAKGAAGDRPSPYPVRALESFPEANLWRDCGGAVSAFDDHRREVEISRRRTKIALQARGCVGDRRCYDREIKREPSSYRASGLMTERAPPPSTFDSQVHVCGISRQSVDAQRAIPDHAEYVISEFTSLHVAYRPG